MGNTQFQLSLPKGNDVMNWFKDTLSAPDTMVLVVIVLLLIVLFRAR